MTLTLAGRGFEPNAPVDLAAGATREQLLAAMKGHVIEQAELAGTYERK